MKKKKAIRTYVCIPDTHVPVHDVRAFGAMMNYVKTLKPDGAVILGDFMDCESLIDEKKGASSPRRITYREELDPANALLDELDLALGGDGCRDKWFLPGNHEHREVAYVIRHPEMADKINIKRDLKLEKRGWKVHPRGRRTLRIGKLQFHHGIYTSASHAAAHATKLGGNVVYGHLHDVQSATVVHGMEPHGAWCLGCLCDLDQKYMENMGRPHNWVHAFGIAFIRADGTFSMNVISIYNGKLIGLDGKEYSA